MYSYQQQQGGYYQQAGGTSYPPPPSGYGAAPQPGPNMYNSQFPTGPGMNYSNPWNQEPHYQPQPNPVGAASQYTTPSYAAPAVPPPLPQGVAPHQSMGGHMMPGPSPTSQLTGRRRALIIGINYNDNPSVHLDGCINDAVFIKYLLMSKFNFNDSNTLVLTDDQSDPLKRPTRQNIIQGMKWLVQGAQPGDSLWFSYSGHGGQTKDMNGDEIDGLDETILPLDYRTAGQIIDDEIFQLLAANVPAGARLTAVMDSCHSGTGMDLPFVYTMGRSASSNQIATTKTTQGDVILFSSCRDDQTAADASSLSSVHTGVLSYLFCKTVEEDIKRGSHISYGKMMQDMLALAQQKGFRQALQISTGRPFDLQTSFII
eukprot:TRINITY_DN21_c0_g3_i1.p1 TRINITY_DN21_c0_g3~~TRINITY_DN21_c0_g3_i1.p1  ORF type:complete len:372 (-),score=111.77 TRINITY_DN21_c0_g3_i1:62-1177(-)